LVRPQLSHFTLQLLVLLGTVVRGGHKIEVFVAIESLHARVPFVKAVLPSDFLAPWEVIDFLKATQVAVDIRLDDRRAPNESYLIIVQEVTVCRIRNVVEVNSWHPIVLH